MDRQTLAKIKGYMTQRNLTLVMLIIAIFTLFYGFHRQQINQLNETTRQSGFHILSAANELQTLTHEAHYGKIKKDSYYQGWSKVLLIEDMAIFIDMSVMAEADKLKHRWREASSDELKKSLSVKRLLQQIKSLKQAVKQSIRSLS